MRRVLDSTGQTDLDLSAPSEAPVASVEDVAALVALLKGRDWMTAALLTQLLGPGWNERKVRAVARAAAPGIVSFPGSPGYKLIGECSLAEIDRAIKTFRSQAADMTARAVLYHNAYHSGRYGHQS